MITTMTTAAIAGTNEPSASFLLLVLLCFVGGVFLLIELFKFVFAPKQYIKRLFCSHYYKCTLNDMWRIYDYKYKCVKCGKKIYRNFNDGPVNKDEHL